MRPWTLLYGLWLLLACPLSAATPAPEAPLALQFDAAGHLVPDLGIKTVSGIYLDTFAAYLSRYGTVAPGIGLVLHDGETFRPTLQIADGELGIGLGARILPVLDITVGAGFLWSPSTHLVTPTVYVSVFHF